GGFAQPTPGRRAAPAGPRRAAGAVVGGSSTTRCDLHRDQHTPYILTSRYMPAPACPAPRHPSAGRPPGGPGAPSSEVAVAEQVELDDLLPLLRARPRLRLGARREAPSREPSVRQQDAHAHDLPDVVRLSRRHPRSSPPAAPPAVVRPARRRPRPSPPAAPARATGSLRPAPRERAGRGVHARRAHRCAPTDGGPPSPGEAQRVRTATASRWCVMGKRSNARSADSP